MKMRFLTTLCAGVMIAAAGPGDLDLAFDPGLRAWVAPEAVGMMPGGNIWISGGFDQGDGRNLGDLVKLGGNGGVAKEPAKGYIRPSFYQMSVAGSYPHPASSRPFPLENGGLLLPTVSGAYLRMDSGGMAEGMAFPDRLEDEVITPQFERDGKSWVIRRRADGKRLLERRNAANGALERSFPQPHNAISAVPGPDGSVRVIAGDEVTWHGWDQSPVENVLLHLDGDDGPIHEMKKYPGSRPIHLAAKPDGSFRVVLGADLSGWMLWPAPSHVVHTIEWYSAEGGFQRRMNFSVLAGRPFPWAESPEGALMVAAGDGTLRLFPEGDGAGIALPNHRGARSILALPDGKWLIDGLHRLNADGGDDETWTAPELSTSATVAELHLLPDGRMLAAGNFASADGFVRNRIVVFRRNDTVDPSFIADDRIGECRSIAVTKHAIHVVTEEPLSMADGWSVNLVKLGFDGTLIADFKPALDPEILLSNGGGHLVSAVQVRAMDDGDILVETRTTTEVSAQAIHRLRPDGTRAPGFHVLRGYDLRGPLLARGNGGFVKGGVIYRANGKVAHDLSETGAVLAPLCEHLGGVLFLDSRNDRQSRVRLWKRGGWQSSFKSPTMRGAREVVAVSGEAGTLYLSVWLADGSPSLLRLRPDGRVDRSFQAPDFGWRHRRTAGDWWTAGEEGKIAYYPAEHEVSTAPLALVWQPTARRLWAGGGFNIVNGQPRDGLARFLAGAGTKR